MHASDKHDSEEIIFSDEILPLGETRFTTRPPSVFRFDRFSMHALLASALAILLMILIPLIFAYKSTLYITYLTTLSASLAGKGWVVLLTSSLLLGLTSAWIAERYADRIYRRIWLYLGSLFVFFTLSYVLTFITTSLDVFSYLSMNGFGYTWLSMLLLAAALPPSAYLILRLIEDVQAASGLGGITALIASLGCPSCGAILWSLLGLSGLSLLPFKGLELKVAALLLLVLTIWFIDRPRPVSTSRLSLREERLFSFLFLGFLIYAIVLVTSTLTLAATVKALQGPSLNTVDVTSLQSTAQTLRTVFPELGRARGANDIVQILIPRGTPSYSTIFQGISYDDPVSSLDKLAKTYPAWKREVQKDPEAWQRYLRLAAAPRGISCEFCCGVGPQGVDKEGNLRCGCSHNLALQSLTLGLVKYSTLSDAEILREVMRWKALFFPKNMVSLASSVAGKDPSTLANAKLPGMVGGC